MTLQQAIFPILELSYEFTSWDVCGPHTEFQHLFHRIIDSQVWRGHLILTPLCSLNALCDIYKKKWQPTPCSSSPVGHWLAPILTFFCLKRVLKVLFTIFASQGSSKASAVLDSLSCSSLVIHSSLCFCTSFKFLIPLVRPHIFCNNDLKFFCENVHTLTQWFFVHSDLPKLKK